MLARVMSIVARLAFDCVLFFEEMAWVYACVYVLAMSELGPQGTVCCVFMHAGVIWDPGTIWGGCFAYA